MKKKCIIFPISMKNVGLLYHFADLSIEMWRAFGDNGEFDIYFLSECGEQNEGLWIRLKKYVPESNIKVYSESGKFIEFVQHKLDEGLYDKIIYLTQGIIQFIHAIPLKRKYGDRLWLYTRLNSFKHGTKYRQILTFMLSYLFKKYADFVNFQCENTVHIFKNSLVLFKAGKAGIISLGLSVEEDSMPDNPTLIRIFNDPAIKRVVYLANFHKHKRHEDLINFMSPLLYQDRNLKLILLGEGVCLNSCKKLVANINLNNQVIFPGRVHRQFVPYILRRSILSIVFSKVETFGHNILEPLYYGCPVVSTNVGIAPNVLRDFGNGAILLTASEKEFHVKSKYFIGGGEIIDRLKIQQEVRIKFSWTNVVDQYKALFISM